MTPTATASLRAIGDISVHVGTLHYTCKAVIAFFKGDMHPGDVYMINDPYAGGTHFSDVRLIRPIFVGDEVIGYAQSNGHWSDMGGSVPGSFDVMAKDMFREGLRITPVRIFDRGRFCRDVAHMIASNTRDPASLIGDMHAQAEATNVAAREVLRLVNKYGKDTVRGRHGCGAGLCRAHRAPTPGGSAGRLVGNGGLSSTAMCRAARA